MALGSVSVDEGVGGAVPGIALPLDAPVAPGATPPCEPCAAPPDPLASSGAVPRAVVGAEPAEPLALSFGLLGFVGFDDEPPMQVSGWSPTHVPCCAQQAAERVPRAGDVSRQTCVMKARGARFRVLRHRHQDAKQIR